MKKLICLILVLVVCGMAQATAWVVVGDAGNAGDPGDKRVGAGAVSYEYKIMATQITVNEWVDFLDAVAIDSSGDLWLSNMGGTIAVNGSQYANVGQIGRELVGDSYDYSVLNNSGNQPVAYMSFSNLARYANWMHNGQPTTGVKDATTTEDGAYDMSITTGLTHKATAKYWIPTDDEFVKAGYYDGSGAYYDFGDAHDYSPYPYASSPPGKPGHLDHSANFGYKADGTGGPGIITDAGAYVDSKSYYGLFDIDGTLMDITETELAANRKIMRGSGFSLSGSYAYRPGTLQTLSTYNSLYNYTGGRLATVVPEPATLVLLSLGFVALRRRK